MVRIIEKLSALNNSYAEIGVVGRTIIWICIAALYFIAYIATQSLIFLAIIPLIIINYFLGHARPRFLRLSEMLVFAVVISSVLFNMISPTPLLGAVVLTVLLQFGCGIGFGRRKSIKQEAKYINCKAFLGILEEGCTKETKKYFVSLGVIVLIFLLDSAAALVIQRNNFEIMLLIVLAIVLYCVVSFGLFSMGILVSEKRKIARSALCFYAVSGTILVIILAWYFVASRMVAIYGVYWS